LKDGFAAVGGRCYGYSGVNRRHHQDEVIHVRTDEDTNAGESLEAGAKLTKSRSEGRTEE